MYLSIETNEPVWILYKHHGKMPNTLKKKHHLKNQLTIKRDNYKRNEQTILYSEAQKKSWEHRHFVSCVLCVQTINNTHKKNSPHNKWITKVRNDQRHDSNIRIYFRNWTDKIYLDINDTADDIKSYLRKIICMHDDDDDSIKNDLEMSR